MKVSSKFNIFLIVTFIGHVSAIAVTVFPKPNGTVTYSKAKVLAKNEIFDGELKRFDRGSRFHLS